MIPDNQESANFCRFYRYYYTISDILGDDLSGKPHGYSRKTTDFPPTLFRLHPENHFLAKFSQDGMKLFEVNRKQVLPFGGLIKSNGAGFCQWFMATKLPGRTVIKYFVAINTIFFGVFVHQIPAAVFIYI